MPPNIAEILEKVERLMEKYGYWKITSFFDCMIILWNLPQLITAIRWW